MHIVSHDGIGVIECPHVSQMISLSMIDVLIVIDCFLFVHIGERESMRTKHAEGERVLNTAVQAIQREVDQFQNLVEIVKKVPRSGVST